MRQTLSALVFLLPIALIPPAASGQGQYGWLDSSPVSVFTAKDWEMLRKNARGALDAAADGSTSSWENPDTGNSGSVTVISSHEKNSRRCRKARFTNKARNMSGTQVHSLCKMADGTWKVAP